MELNPRVGIARASDKYGGMGIGGTLFVIYFKWNEWEWVKRNGEKERAIERDIYVKRRVNKREL